MNIKTINEQSEVILNMQKALNKVEHILGINSTLDDVFEEAFSKNEPIKLEEYGCTLSEHKDGSGWSVNLNGTYMAKEILVMVHKRLIEKIEFEKGILKKMIEDEG